MVKEFKVIKIGSGLEQVLQIPGRGFDSFEKAEQDLLRMSPENIGRYTILPIYTFEPER